MAWPPATISRNYSNRFLPNLRQNVSKGRAYSYWKRWCWQKIVLEKLKKNLMGGGVASTHPPLHARGLTSPEYTSEG